MHIKAKIALALSVLTLVSSYSCARNEAEELQQTLNEQEQTIEVDLHLEATATMPDDSELRAGGLQMKYNSGVPTFRLTSDQATIEAHCVFKPLKQGSTTELDDSRALYGTVTFKRKAGAEPGMEDGKSTGVELISEGKVTLRGSGKLSVGEQWYVMGLVGGTPDAQGKKVTVNGMLAGFEENGQFTGVDNNNQGTVPFLSKWIKLGRIKEENKIEAMEKMSFRFQGMLIALDLKNGTNYNLSPLQVTVQSTELTNKVAYDLGSSNTITDTPEMIQWSDEGDFDATNRWRVIYLHLGGLYRLDTRESTNNQSYVYDVREPQKNRVTFVFWVNAMEGVALKRTGFFVKADNMEAKPAWNESISNGQVTLSTNEDLTNMRGSTGGSTAYDQYLGKPFKYVLTSDPDLDGITSGTTVLDGNSPKKGKYPADIRMAPSMENICARTIQRSLINNRGKYVHLTVTVPERPVMPIETMAQNNMYRYRNNGNGINFVYFPGLDRYDKQTQTADYTKGFTQASENNNSYWMLPSLNQWYGILMAGHNQDNSHNWNDIAYGFFEGDSGDYGLEDIEFANGDKKTYYAMYGRPKKDEPNNNVIYALRFFSDQDKTRGSNQLALSRYTYTTLNNREVIKIDAVWLGPEYAKLYEGVYKDQRQWLREIANNDNGGEKSLFRNLRKDFVTRYLIVEPSSTRQYNFAVPSGWDRSMIGYFYGPSQNFASSARARAIAIKNKTLFTGASASLGVDFTNYHSTGNAEAYVRPIRRDFTSFAYKL